MARPASLRRARRTAWEELVTAALLGTDRRTPPGSRRARRRPAALLDAAAVQTVRRRAGLRPARAARGREPAPEDPRPALPAAAAPQARDAAGRPPRHGRRRPRGTAPDLMELLPQWLAAANARGYARAPAAAARAAGRGPGPYGSAAGGAGVRGTACHCGWPG